MNASAAVPAFLCDGAPAELSDEIDAGAREYAAHLRAIADWSAEALRGVVLRHEAGNLLDSLVTWLPQLRLQAEFEAAGAARAEEQLALLVRSFHACGA